MMQLLLNPQGRISRKTFWLYILAYYGIYLVTVAIDTVVIGTSLNGIQPISLVFSLLAIWPGIAISTKRLHDRTMSGWWQLVPLLILIIGFLPGHPGRNKYGHNPLEPETGDLGEVFS